MNLKKEQRGRELSGLRELVASEIKVTGICKGKLSNRVAS